MTDALRRGPVCWASRYLMAGGGLVGESRGVLFGTTAGRESLVGAASRIISPIKLRNISGTSSATDQRRFRCPFIWTSLGHRRMGIVAHCFEECANAI